VRRGSVECVEAHLERRDSAGCGVVHQGATWLSGVRRGPFGAGGLLGQCSVHYRVLRGSVGIVRRAAAIISYEIGPERGRSFKKNVRKYEK
jgi:hypothetical protein